MFNYDSFLLHSFNIIKSLPIAAWFCSYLLVKNTTAARCRTEWAALSCWKHRFTVSWMGFFSLPHLKAALRENAVGASAEVAGTLDPMHSKR